MKLNVFYVRSIQSQFINAISILISIPITIPISISISLCFSSLQLGVDVDGKDTVFLGLANRDVGPAIGANNNGLASATGAALLARDDIAIGAGWESSLEGTVHVVVVVVEGNKATIATAEGDLVVAIIPPVLHLGRSHGIPESNHVVDLAPTMLTDPSSAAGLVAVESGRGNVLAIGCRWSLVGVVEGERRHHTGCAEGMGQHEGGGHFVLLGHLVGEDIGATGTMSTLVIVVVHKDKRTIGGSESPGGAPVAQVTQLVLAAEHLANGIGVTELGDGSHAGIFGLLDGLAAQVDDLLDDVGLGARAEAMTGIQILQASIDGSQISRPHVFGGIHTETGNTQIRQMVEEINNPVPHPRAALVQITEPNKLAIAHISGIIVVGDATGRIKVQRGEGNSREALRSGIS